MPGNKITRPFKRKIKGIASTKHTNVAQWDRKPVAPVARCHSHNADYWLSLIASNIGSTLNVLVCFSDKFGLVHLYFQDAWFDNRMSFFYIHWLMFRLIVYVFWHCLQGCARVFMLELKNSSTLHEDKDRL